MTRIIAPVAALVAALFLGGIWWVTQSGGEDGQFAQCNSTQIAGDGNGIGGPFELVNAEGQTVTDQDVITEPSLIYFGYTFCPDVCPLDTARNAEAVDVLAERGMSVTPIFITVDPERDTPEIVGDFAYNLHEKMIGLTGSLEQTDAASKTYRTYYKAHDKSDEFYLVDHSTFTYLVMPEHGFVEFFRRDITAETMADRVACFVENA
ncbi:SCO family protein [Tateyamaria sp. ANG-S1]|uniref:SCO family protein n=1 Tax=Tateyamaria sp. ANG-S1 TaxID=1577905 RepID=UPI00057F59D6|nr:SCO family protein [Tateyamaria sp. ANG-S1]KIC49769.1 protein senC [Tateyamaria sp. ANG-S1]